MKKNRIAVALLAGALLMLSSCVKEQLGGDEIMTFNEDEVAFRIGSVSTKADALAQPVVLDIATVERRGADMLYLQDEVTTLDGVAGGPATKGTPAYTENVNVLYPAFNVVALKGDVSTLTPVFRNGSLSGETFDYVTGSYVAGSANSIYKHNYGEGIWGIDNEKLPTYFFMRMPATQNGVTLPENPYNLETGAISFNYTSPEAAASQQDILFTSHKRETAVNGETIVFYHALTGVKFANFFNNDTTNPNNKTETLIREVTISGLKNTGSCVVTPSAGEGTGKSAAAADWTLGEGTASFTQAYVEAFAQYGDAYSLNEKLDQTATARNLNDANGSLTFWFIPQTLTSNVKIKVKFDIRVNDAITFQNQELEVSLGDALDDSHKTWHAGELHTFTLRPEKVGVKIEDSIAQYTKSNVRITNTGNVDQYVRVYMIGNWYGERQISEDGYNDYESILMGYTDNAMNDAGEYINYIEVARWNDKDFTWEGAVGSNKVFAKWESPGKPEGYDYIPYGEFTGLPEMGSASGPGRDNGEHWLRHDKFYYYTELIGPGKDLPSTDPLFTEYTIDENKVPVFWIADNSGVRRKARNVHFVMDIAVQAIAVPYDEDGNPIGYEDAWKQALGVTDINDL